MKRLAELMDFDMDETGVEKIMKYLRTQLLKEKRKEEDSQGRGKATEDTYFCKWKFYTSLNILVPFVCLLPQQSNLMQDNNNDLEEEDEDIDGDVDVDDDLVSDANTVKEETG